MSATESLATSTTSLALSRWQLAASSALSPFALVVVSPMLPEFRRMFDATEADVQYVISAYLFGLCLAQLVLGALSDRFGRRVVLLTSLMVYIAMTVVCAYAPTLDILIMARFVQACGAAGTAAIARASVHDIHRGDAAAYYMSYIAAAHSFAHTSAPVVGGFVGDAVGITGVFMGLAALGVVMLVWSWHSMPETRPRALGQRAFSIANLITDNVLMMRSPIFVCYALIYGLTGAPFFAFLAAAPSYFADHFGATGGAFGVYWSFMSVAFLAGAMTSARLVNRMGSHALIKWMILTAGMIGLGWPVLVSVAGVTVFNLIAPLVLLSGVLGLITPLTLSGAIGAHPQQTGAASGLCGALTMACSAVLTIVAGHFYDGTGLGLTWPLTVSMVAMMGSYLGLRVFERPTAKAA